MLTLVPAITRKDDIEKEMRKMYYGGKMFYLSGWNGNWMPEIVDCPDDSRFQYAIVNDRQDLIGYLDYHVNWYNSSASRFGIVAFKRGYGIINNIFSKEIRKLIYEHHIHRIEWRMIEGNHVEVEYDSICKKYKGSKHVLKDYVKDKYGNYHNDIIYEIITEQGE